MHSDLPPGFYDLISSTTLREQLEKLGLGDAAEFTDVSKDNRQAFLTRHLSKIFADQLGQHLASQSPEQWKKTIDAWLHHMDLHHEMPDVPVALTRIKPHGHHLTSDEPARPDTALSVSALLTGSSRSPALRSQLKKELATSDRADWLVSFVKYSGLVPLMETLRQFTNTPAPDGRPRLRLATTSYMGATDPKAIEELLKLPNVEIRVSYDTNRTRLHAKAYLFHRLSGFGSAYIGSANVSKAALDEGLEWTAKISQYEIPYLWEHAVATFDSHWEDETEFTPCRQVNLPDLQKAIQAERTAPSPVSLGSFFDLKPHDFQRAILQDIAEERMTGQKHHLIVAATGTGKTMIAAFDYRSQCEATGHRPRLLFIAHRQEILEQALNAFRHVLRDHSFGEMKTGHTTISQLEHVFCTVQSWNSQRFDQLEPDRFAYVVLDEAHHASAETYQRIVNHVEPDCLLGLTATPERADGMDIRDDFGGSFTHEIRLPEAIDRRLLCPFHYYGVPDAVGVNFSRLDWQAGRYNRTQLQEMLDHNAQRAQWVLEQVDHYLTDIRQSRALGFCVSKAHAIFMANFFNEHNVAACALTADTPEAERHDTRSRLQSGKIQIIFCVDLFNEGVDIPAIDTVLFLRPTESLTVFLQQLGRGLRLEDNKPHLTVLDFIAPQHRNFRYANRYQALTTRTDIRIDNQLQNDMPYVPSGCLIHLEKQAKDHVLGNIREATSSLQKSRLLEGIRQLQSAQQEPPKLSAILSHFMLDSPDDLYKKGIPSDLTAEATGEVRELPAEWGKPVAKGMRRLLLQDDTRLLSALKEQLVAGTMEEETANLLHAELWGSKRPGANLAAIHAYLLKHPGLRRDLLDLIEWQQKHMHPHASHPVDNMGVLNLHASYSRAQVLLALGKGSVANPFSSREGVLHLPERKLDIFFADINKSSADFSPTTMYDDYAITDRLFHWQSQSQTSVDSATGQRYIHHQEQGYTPMLFIRDRKSTPTGLTAPYLFAGPLRYRSHRGSNPISITWELEQPLPAKALAWARRSA